MIGIAVTVLFVLVILALLALIPIELLATSLIVLGAIAAYMGLVALGGGPRKPEVEEHDNVRRIR